MCLLREMASYLFLEAHVTLDIWVELSSDLPCDLLLFDDAAADRGPGGHPRDGLVDEGLDRRPDPDLALASHSGGGVASHRDLNDDAFDPGRLARYLADPSRIPSDEPGRSLAISELRRAVETSRLAEVDPGQVSDFLVRLPLPLRKAVLTGLLPEWGAIGGAPAMLRTILEVLGPTLH